jgi:hypothetical protein
MNNEKPDFEQIAEELFPTPNMGTYYFFRRQGAVAACERIWNDYVVPLQSQPQQGGKTDSCIECGVDDGYVDHKIIEGLERCYNCGNGRTPLATSRTEPLVAEIEQLKKEVEWTGAAWKKDRDLLQVKRLEAESEVIRLREALDILPSSKIRLLAQYLDKIDEKAEAMTGSKRGRECQEDLRKFADAVDSALSSSKVDSVKGADSLTNGKEDV